MSTANSVAAETPDDAGTGRGAHRHLVLVLLSLAYAMHSLDRVLFSLLVEPIKAEFHLSDTQMGTLSGLAFAVFYVGLAVPIANLSDIISRKLVIVASVLLFSVATLGCGLAGGFVSLLFCRMLVGVGEAGPNPASGSLLADLYPARSRPLVMSLYVGSASIGTSLILLSIGGLASDHGWRTLLLGAGVVGMVIALLIAAIVREPARPVGLPPRPNPLRVLLELLRIRSFMLMSFGIGMGAFAGLSAMNWLPSFLMRAHGLTEAQTSLFVALGWGLTSAAGTFLLGLLTSWYDDESGRKPLLQVAVVLALSALCYCIGFSVENMTVALVMLTFGAFFLAGCTGPVYGLIQNIVPPDRRATAMASLLLIAYGIGWGLGPVSTGFISDLASNEGTGSLSFALRIIVIVGGAAGSTLLWLASRRIAHDIRSD